MVKKIISVFFVLLILVPSALAIDLNDIKNMAPDDANAVLDEIIKKAAKSKDFEKTLKDIVDIKAQYQNGSLMGSTQSSLGIYSADLTIFNQLNPSAKKLPSITINENFLGLTLDRSFTVGMLLGQGTSGQITYLPTSITESTFNINSTNFVVKYKLINEKQYDFSISSGIGQTYLNYYIYDTPTAANSSTKITHFFGGNIDFRGGLEFNYYVLDSINIGLGIDYMYLDLPTVSNGQNNMSTNLSNVVYKVSLGFGL